MNYTYSDQLYHHGIIGQRWGIRRYQNPDGTLTAEGRARYGYEGTGNTIPKGTVMYRSSVNPNESMKGHAYVTVNEYDRNHYRGGRGANWIKQTSGSKDLYEYTYKLKKDVNLATKDDLVEAYKELQKTDKNLDKDNKKFLEEFYSKNQGSADREQIEYLNYIVKEYGKNPVNQKELAEYKKSYKDNLDKVMTEYGSMSVEDKFLSAYAPRIGENDKTREQITKILKDKGFDGMLDYASIGDNYYRKGAEGIAPMIVFDKESTLEVSKVKKVSDRQQAKYGGDYNREANIRNKNRQRI